MLLTLLLGCTAAVPEPAPTVESVSTAAELVATRGPLRAWAPIQWQRSVEAPGLDEASGLAPSRKRPGAYFTMEDSDNPPVLTVFDLEQGLIEQHPVAGAEVRDWEDLAAGPCPGSTDPCLFIGEIGDNEHVFPWVAVLAVPEPDPGQPAAVSATWRATYPQGARNAEALLVQPLTGRVYLVTKDSDGASAVYRFPAQPGDEIGVLEHVADIHFSGERKGWRKATGGDWNAAGTRLAIRTYDHAWLWETIPDEPEIHWTTRPLIMGLGDDEQGEGITFTATGQLLANSEGSPMTLQILALDEMRVAED